MKFYKYQGAGNDFLIADNRDGHISVNDGILTDSEGCHIVISDICDRRYGIGADGLMLLEKSGTYDFRMTYFNSDGSTGMMCGNGGRCIVAFAADMGLEHFDFEASDGFHTARILRNSGREKTICLKMKDVSSVHRYDSLVGTDVPSDGYFLDTGTRHYVRFVDDVDAYDVTGEGRSIRYNARELQPVGANVNYVTPMAEGLIKVRTYEKGVEDETFACGTGIVASCISAFVHGVSPVVAEEEKVRYDVLAKRDALSVEFSSSGSGFCDVWLTGPATFVAEISRMDMGL